MSEGTLINGKTYRVPKALGNKKFHPYGDFLLHDIGTGPTILREGMPPESRGKIRTAALWGLGTRLASGQPLLHDGTARTLEDAILRHKNTAAQEAEEFRRLSERDRTRVLKLSRKLSRVSRACQARNPVWLASVSGNGFGLRVGPAPAAVLVRDRECRCAEPNRSRSIEHGQSP